MEANWRVKFIFCCIFVLNEIVFIVVVLAENEEEDKNGGEEGAEVFM